MLAGSKLGLGTAGNGMENCQCGKPIRHFTFSTDQKAHVINSQFRYFHSHSCPHRHPPTVWLHVYKAIYRNRRVGWVIQVQTTFQQTEEETEEILLLPLGSCQWHKKMSENRDIGLFFQYLNTHFRVSVQQIKEKSRQSTTQGLPRGHDSTRATFDKNRNFATKMSNPLVLN